jgi:hypothetical protein
MKLICYSCDSEINNEVYCTCKVANYYIIDVYINNVEKYYYTYSIKESLIYIFDSSSNQEVYYINYKVTFDQLKNCIENLIFV